MKPSMVLFALSLLLVSGCNSSKKPDEAKLRSD